MEDTAPQKDKVPKTPEYDFLNCRTVKSGIIEKSDVIAAIDYTNGNLSAIGRLLSKPRSAVKNYIDQNQDLLLLLVDIRESLLDNVEQSTFQAAISGDATNQRFLLQTLGKDRGYTTKTESDVTNRVDPSLTAMLERIGTSGKRLVEGHRDAE